MTAPLHFCPRLQRYHKLAWEDIRLLEGHGNYTMLHLHNGQRILTSKTLKRYETIVPPAIFWRVNKTYIIRPEEIVQWYVRSDKILLLTLASGHTCEVSRRKRVSVKRDLKLLFLH